MTNVKQPGGIIEMSEDDYINKRIEFALKSLEDEARCAREHLKIIEDFLIDLKYQLSIQSQNHQMQCRSIESK